MLLEQQIFLSAVLIYIKMIKVVRIYCFMTKMVDKSIIFK